MTTREDLYAKLKSVRSLSAAVRKPRKAKKSTELSMLESSLQSTFPDTDQSTLDEIASNVIDSMTHDVGYALEGLHETVESTKIKNFKTMRTSEDNISREEDYVYFHVNATFPSVIKWEITGKLSLNKIMADAIKEALQWSEGINKNELAKAVVDSKAIFEIVKKQTPSLSRKKTHNIVELHGEGMEDSFEDYFFNKVDISVDWDEDAAPDVHEFPFEYKVRQDTYYVLAVTSAQNSNKITFSYTANIRAEIEWK